ncbi:MAG: RING finger protein [Thermoplasmata archaeon]
MSPPGISPYKLTKDLEEKVKEAKQKKEEFDLIYPKYKFLQSILLKNGIDKFNDVFKKIDDLYNDKKFVDAYDLLLNYKENIDNEIINLIESYKNDFKANLEKLQNLGFNVSKFKEDIEKSPIDKEEFFKFYDKLNENLKIFIKNQLKEEISKLNSENKIKIERAYGKQIENLEKLSKEEFFSVIEEIKKIITEYYMQKINVEMERMDRLRSLYEKMKLNLSKFKELDEFALNAIKTENYDLAIKKIKEFNDETEISVRRILREIINNLMKNIEEAKNLNINIKDYLNDLKKIEETFDKNDFSSTIDLVKGLNLTIEEIKIKILSEKLEEVRRHIQKLRNQGINVEEFLKSFDIAKNLINSKKFNDAMKVLDLLLKQASSILNLKEEVLRDIDNFEKNFVDFPELGIIIDKNYLDELKRLANENPSKAKSEFEKYETVIAKKMENNKTKYIDQMKDIVNTLKRMSADTSDLDNILKGNINGTNFLNIIKSFKNQLLDHFSNMDYLKSILRDLDNERINRDLKPLIENIKESIEKYDFFAVSSGIKRLRESSMDLKNAFINEKFNNLKKSILNLNAIGLDLKPILNDLDMLESEKILSDDKKIELINLLENEIYNDAQNFIKPRLEFGDSVIKNIKIRNLRIDTEIISKRLGDLKNHKKLNDLPDAFKISMDIENMAKNKQFNAMNYLASTSFINNKLSKYIENISEYLDEYKENPEDFEQFKKIMGTVDQYYGLQSFKYLRSLIREVSEIIEISGLYQDKGKLLDLKNIDLMSLEPLYIELDKIRNDFRDKVYQKLQELVINISNISISELKNQIDNSINEFLNYNYLEAWKKSNELENELKAINKKYQEVTSQLKSLEERVRFFTNIGFELEETKEIFEKLNSLILKGNLEEFMNIYKESYITIKDEIYLKVDEFLSNAEKLIIQKKNKINTLIAESNITNARRSLKLDNAIEAIRLGMLALEGIQEYDILKGITEKLIRRMKLSQEKFGTNAPKEFTTGFEKVQILIHQGNYTNAIFEMHNLLSKFEELSESISIIKKKIEEIKEKISVSVVFGVKTQNVLDLYQKARLSFQSLDVDKSINLLNEALKVINIEIEKILSYYMNTINYLFTISQELKLELKTEVKNINDLILEIIKYSFNKNSNKNTITNVANELKKRLDEFENLVVPKINETFQAKLINLELAIKNTGMENTSDLKLLNENWSKKLYSMIIDMLPMVDYKITKYYIIHMMDYSKNTFLEITDMVVFTGKIENSVNESFKLTENAGNIEFENYIQINDKFINDLRNSINRNFDEKITLLKNFLKENEIAMLKDLLFKKDYRTLEVSLININIMNYWSKTVEKFIKEKINYIEEKIEKLQNLGINLSDEKSRLEGIKGKSYAESIMILDQVNQMISAKESSIPISFKIKLNAKIGKDEIPAKVTINYDGKIALKNVKLKILGSLNETTFNFDLINPMQSFERDFISKIGKGNTLDFEISYILDNENRVSKKSVLFMPVIERGFIKKKATGDEKCMLCKGKIFKDLDMVICNKCGSTYHYQCAQRVKKCINCGNAFDFSEYKDVEVSLTL